MNRSEYQIYLASREWALKREAVRVRSNNCCERCLFNSMDAVHHKTYERVGNELLEDLMAICDHCHEFLSGKREFDPIVRTKLVSMKRYDLVKRFDKVEEGLSDCPQQVESDFEIQLNLLGLSLGAETARRLIQFYGKPPY